MHESLLHELVAAHVLICLSGETSARDISSVRGHVDAGQSEDERSRCDAVDSHPRVSTLFASRVVVLRMIVFV